MVVDDLNRKISGGLSHFKEQLAVIRGGRPTPKLVEDIPVECYGQKMAVKQLGAISVVPPREIQISVWDKAVVPLVAKAIESSNLNVSANVDGNLIRINLPSLSDERRRELLKIAKKESEEARIKIRHLRDEKNKEINKMESDGEINEDQNFKLKEETQKMIDKANGEIEELLGRKIKEINE